MVKSFIAGKMEGTEEINLKDALKKSCDIYFYEVARLLGVDRLAETIRKFDFGQDNSLKDFDEERKGLVPDTKWKKNVLGKPWLLRGDFDYRNRTRLYTGYANANLQINGQNLQTEVIKLIQLFTLMKNLN